MSEQKTIKSIALTTLKVGDSYHYADTDSALCELPEDEFNRQLDLGNVREATAEEAGETSGKRRGRKADQADAPAADQAG